MKKLILVAILSMFILSSGFGAGLINNVPLSQSSICTGDTITLKFYVTDNGTVPTYAPYTTYTVYYYNSGSPSATTTSIPCTSWYTQSSPGVIKFAIPSSSTTRTYKLFVRWMGSGIPPSPPTIVVNPLPTISIITDNPNYLCSGQTAMLTASGARTYSWSTTDRKSVV